MQVLHPPFPLYKAPTDTRQYTSRSHGKTLEQPHSWAVATRCIRGSISSLEAPPGTSPPHTHSSVRGTTSTTANTFFIIIVTLPKALSALHLTCFRPQLQIPPLHQVCPPQNYHLALDTHSSTQWEKEQALSQDSTSYQSTCIMMQVHSESRDSCADNSVQYLDSNRTLPALQAAVGINP